MSLRISRYFSPRSQPQLQQEPHIKAIFYYSTPADILLAPAPWTHFRYGRTYDGLKLLLKDKLLNLAARPVFTDHFPHQPGTAAECYLHIHDTDLHAGQLRGGDRFQLLYHDITSGSNYVIGHGVIGQVLKQQVKCFTPKAFTGRYALKLAPVGDVAGFAIDVSDAVSRLQFVKDYGIRLTGSREELLEVNLHTHAPSLSQGQLRLLLRAMEYLRYDVIRYRLEYRSDLADDNDLLYRDIDLLVATWNDLEYATLRLKTTVPLK